MDAALSDELLEYIFQRLPPSSAAAVSLVSRRWLPLLRSSIASLSIRLPTDISSSSAPTAAAADRRRSLSTLLSHYPFLTSLTVISSNSPSAVADDSDLTLLFISSSTSSHHLSHLRLFLASPISPTTLLLVSSSFSRLTSLHVSSISPFSFRWLAHFPLLRKFSLIQTVHSTFIEDDEEEDDGSLTAALPLEFLSLTGLKAAADGGAAWLWRRCRNLRRLQLRNCEGVGDRPLSPYFSCCLAGLQELELRTCRTIASRVLLRAAEHCRHLTSLLLYDGGNRDALHHFICNRGMMLRKLDLRLPLDLDNGHLIAIASEGPGIDSLRLQSCCLITGEGLSSLALSPAGLAIEELALVNCDVVEREPGLLTALCQGMRRLRKLDLSYNEMLFDKEVGSMLASCNNLVDIKLKGCGSLTDNAVFSLLKFCGERLESVDISRCPGTSILATELLILKAGRLKQIWVEESKISEAAKAWISVKRIAVG